VGESAQPYKTVPRAIKATFIHIVLFYILTILTIGLCINYQDPTLLGAAGGVFQFFYELHCRSESYFAPDSDVAASPLTAMFVRAGFRAAAHIINAALLTAVLSATNSCFYASSRMLLSLARSGQAPRIFGWVNNRGVPVPALISVLQLGHRADKSTLTNRVALAVSFVTFLTSIWGEEVVFT
jgi:amino acid permease